MILERVRKGNRMRKPQLRRWRRSEVGCDGKRKERERANCHLLNPMDTEDDERVGEFSLKKCRAKIQTNRHPPMKNECYYESSSSPCFSK